MKRKTKNRDFVYAFIDSQNLNLGVKCLGWTLDFQKFRKYLKDKYNVRRAFLFIGQVPGHNDLYASLKAFGYTVVFKPTVSYKNNGRRLIKGNVDAELVLHTMIQWNNYDKAMIVSGDGDFYCLVKHLYKKKKLMKILVPNNRYSALLREFANKITSVGSIEGKVRKL